MISESPVASYCESDSSTGWLSTNELTAEFHFVELALQVVLKSLDCFKVILNPDTFFEALACRRVMFKRQALATFIGTSLALVLSSVSPLLDNNSK